MAISKIKVGTTEHELQTTIANVTGLQDALDAKQATITGAATTITSSNLTQNRALISNRVGKVAACLVTAAELVQLEGVTDNVQTQLDSKVDLTSVQTISGSKTFSSGIILGDSEVSIDGEYDGSNGICRFECADGNVILSGVETPEENYQAANKLYVDTIADTKFNAVQNVTTTADLDDYTTSGIYYFNGSSTVSNIPIGSNGWLLVMNQGTTSTYTIKQIWFRYGTQDTNDWHTYVRTNYSAGWSSWRQIITSEELDDEISALHGGKIGKSGSGIASEIFNDYTNNKASGDYSHAEGDSSEALGAVSHAEGSYVIASGDYSHAEGDNSEALGIASHAEGCAVATGNYSHAEGYNTRTNGAYSHAEGYSTVANIYQCAVGKYNKNTTAPTSLSDTTASAGVFIVGVGSGTSARSNGFRVNPAGKSYGLSTFAGSGADYAEYFEWADGNPSAEDRRGRFVTLDGEKIRYATVEDDYILGVVSSEPSVVGDSQSEEWRDVYLRDIFGSKIQEVVEVDETTDKNGSITPAHTERRWKLNPNYDSNQEYISREDRPEWDAIGLVGKLVVIDDGTCKVNGYCCPSVDGIATASKERTSYRVIARLDDNHIRVFIK